MTSRSHSDADPIPVTRPLLHPVALGPDEGLPLLDILTAGRLIHHEAGLPAVRVLRHCRDFGYLVVRVQLPVPPAVFRCPGRLTYQTEWVDPQDHTGWTVTVSGPAQRITNGYQQARYRLMLHAGPQNSYEHLLRIRPDNVTGYRLTRAPA
ncbi:MULTISPECIES: pyridoxamine 5'-phosphate oxidase family protein [unclassified Streptomyces]|uniref:pyridoxamine 5'-phosphate oxidase family protein n=1 Tax=unclassified Streptomyces TaxID=2593676 RepID=UPI0011B038CF|nr:MULTISPECIES: pyridoxamine 5'-phosphate oxidase family protein [unclassified Streptomyces]